MTNTDDDRDEWPVVQLRTTATPAQHQEAPRLCSVFDLARFTLTMRGKATMQAHRQHRRIERSDGVTRCTVLLAQETPEYKIREAVRRAKQVLPKPPRSAKTFSKKFAALVGMSA